eukprot:5500935-Prymnesium_polylepis.1
MAKLLDERAQLQQRIERLRTNLASGAGEVLDALDASPPTAAALVQPCADSAQQRTHTTVF